MNVLEKDTTEYLYIYWVDTETFYHIKYFLYQSHVF